MHTCDPGLAVFNEYVAVAQLRAAIARIVTGIAGRRREHEPETDAEGSGEEADLIRRSFRIAAQDGQRAARRFYEILFEQAPHTRHLFVNDMGRQGTELMSKLGIIVAELQTFEGLRPLLPKRYRCSSSVRRW